MVIWFIDKNKNIFMIRYLNMAMYMYINTKIDVDMYCT
jgi:hypothetical protein